MVGDNVNNVSSPIASTLLLKSWLMYVGLLAERMRSNISDSDSLQIDHFSAFMLL